MPKIFMGFDGCCEPVNPGGTASYGAVVFMDGKRVWDCSELFVPAARRRLRIMLLNTAVSWRFLNTCYTKVLTIGVR
jgi:hypothetical protein